MGWRRFLVVGVLLAGGCASARTADEPVPEVTLPAVPATVPTTSVPVPVITALSPQTCSDDLGGVDPGIDSLMDDWVGVGGRSRIR